MKWWQKVLGLLRVILDRANDAGLIAAQRPGPIIGDPRELAGKGEVRK